MAEAITLSLAKIVHQSPYDLLLVRIIEPRS
jgi:hypothetical protein